MCNVSAYYTEDYDNAVKQLSAANEKLSETEDRLSETEDKLSVTEGKLSETESKLSESDAKSAKSIINNIKKYNGTKEDALSSMITDMEFSEEKAMKFINELW